jgi:hypothetical protein
MTFIIFFGVLFGLFLLNSIASDLGRIANALEKLAGVEEEEEEEVEQ